MNEVARALGLKSAGTRYWYHIRASKNWGWETHLYPQGREGASNRPDHEPDTPRTCVAPTIHHCFGAVDIWEKTFVYRTSKPLEAWKPVGVYDAYITREAWILDEVDMRLVMVIEDSWLRTNIDHWLSHELGSKYADLRKMQRVGLKALRGEMQRVGLPDKWEKDGMLYFEEGSITGRDRVTGVVKTREQWELGCMFKGHGVGLET